MDNRTKWATEKLLKLSIEQKAGQMMVFGAAGPVPSAHVEELITKYHVGGFRVAQKFFYGSSESREKIQPEGFKTYNQNTIDRSSEFNTKRIACTPKEYAETLNHYRRLAMESNDGIGLHFVYDQEGEGADMLFSQRLFPYPMGIAAAGDLELAEEAAYCAAVQARALGLNMIHSPVLDVNTNPENPEIGPRSYSDNPQTVAEFASAALRGYKRAGIVCTAKHFPGRGASSEDAHFGLPVIDVGRETFEKEHAYPFKRLIKEGVGAIMMAFTGYTAFKDSDLPAAANPAIATDYLRGELGFDGVVTTDNVQMKGLLNKFELSEAVIRCISAGCDIVLFRSESPATIYVLEKVVQAVRSGRISEKRLDEAVLRILKMRYDMNLHINGGLVDVSKADCFDNAEIIKTAEKAARESTLLLKNGGLLPIDKNKRVLLIEQAHHFHCFINNMYSHPTMLYEQMRRHSSNVSLCLIAESYTERDRQAVLARLKEKDYDIVVCTSYYNYRSHACMVPLLNEIKDMGINPVVLSNTPYAKFGVPDYIENSVVSFCPSGRENMAAAADMLFGALKNSAKLNVKLKAD